MDSNQNNLLSAEKLNVALCLVAACAAGLLMHAILPNMIVALNDDFGYYRSILQTYAKGRPWTNDWLEPWAVSLSGLSAILLALTNSFVLATHGIQIGCFAVSAGLLCKILSMRGIPGPWSLAVSLLTFTNATVLWKSVEFTSVILTTPLLLAAVYAALHKRWLTFLVIWCIGIGARQSSIAWGALALLVPTSIEFPKGFYFQMIRGAIIGSIGALLYFALGRYMNETYAQRVMTAHMWRSLSFSSSAFTFLVNLSIFAVSTGIGALFCSLGNRDGSKSSPMQLSRCVAALGCLLMPVLASKSIQLEHSFYDHGWNRLYIWSISLAGASGWVFMRCAISAQVAFAGICAAILVSIRSAVWDYYLIDIVFLGLISPFSTQQNVATFASVRNIVCTVLCCIALLSSVHSVNGAKKRVDEASLIIQGLETGLRTNAITPADLGSAPFGYIGWHLYPHFVKTEGDKKRYIADFLRYTSAQPAWWTTRAANDNSPISDEGTVFTTETGKVGWQHSHQFIFRRNVRATNAPLALDLATYQLEPYPLTNNEWLALASRYRAAQR